MTIAEYEKISRKDQARNAGGPLMGVTLRIHPIFTVIRRLDSVKATDPATGVNCDLFHILSRFQR